MLKRENWLFLFAALGGFGGLAAILQYLNISPKNLRMSPTPPHVLWLVGSLGLFAVSMILSIWTGVVQRRTITGLREKIADIAHRADVRLAAELIKVREERQEEIRRMEMQHKSELESSEEAYRQCMLERGAAIKGAEDCLAKLAKRSEWLSEPLQIDALDLAQDLLRFVSDFEPIPGLLGPNHPSKEKEESRAERIRWRERFTSGFQHRFAERLKIIQLKFKEAGVATNYEGLMSGAIDPDNRARLHAAALIGMAYRMSGVYLDVIKI
jgi:hypothetical protein